MLLPFHAPPQKPVVAPRALVQLLCVQDFGSGGQWDMDTAKAQMKAFLPNMSQRGPRAEGFGQENHEMGIILSRAR